MTKLVIDPVTRIEGHLKIEVDVKDNKVIDAHSSGGLFRGFEILLNGRDPRDATQITQRICGVCPTAHATASVCCLDNAFKVKPSTQGRILRNLVLASNYLSSHILHFYHLVALDYVKGPETEPFIPRYAGDYRLDRAVNDLVIRQYLEALKIQALAQEMIAVWGGKMPHVSGLVVGGCTATPRVEEIAAFKKKLTVVKNFTEKTYLPTVYLVAGAYKDLSGIGIGFKNVISHGVFPLDDDQKSFMFKPGTYTQGTDLPFDPREIREFVKYSWYDNSTTGLNPRAGKTIPAPDKSVAYSYIKAIRYKGLPHETGPLARQWIANSVLSKNANKFLGLTNDKEVRFRDLGDKAFSILGRLIARAEESAMVAAAMEKWTDQVRPDMSGAQQVEVPANAEGVGFTEAPRGSLSHWISIKDEKIANYQVCAPTIWNASPRDDQGILGPIEQALLGTPVADVKNPINVVRVIRSFDP
jgi:hydrogenase large subunit